MGLFEELSVNYLHTKKPEQKDFVSHMHDSYEIYYFLTGNGSFCVEGNVYPLSQGDLFITRAVEAHHLILHGDEPYTRITIHFRPGKDMDEDLKKYLLSMYNPRCIGVHNCFSARQFYKANWHTYIKELYKTDNMVKRQIYLLNILLELADSFPKIVDDYIHYPKDNVLRITHYIDEHFMEPISLEQICQKFFISQSQLNRNFKNNLGMTVKVYINRKRLFYANDLLKQGESPIQIYTKCGFNDYNTFYKAYRKQFGHSPKQE